MRFASTLLVMVLYAAPGCADQGALGQSSITQGCPAGDAQCHPEGIDAPIAAGASVNVAVDLSLQGGGAPPLTLISANEDVLTAEGQTLTGVAPGIASLLYTSEGSVVLDFTTIWVQSASALVIERRADDGAIIAEMPGDLGLLVGDEVAVSVSARSSTQPLVGVPPATWSADPAVVTLLDEGIPGRQRLAARAPGKTVVTVSALGLSRSFSVEVTP